MCTFLPILIFFHEAYIIPPFGKNTIYAYKKEDKLNERR